MIICGMASHSVFTEFIINPKSSENQVNSIKFFKNIITVQFIMNLILLNLLSNICKWCRNSPFASELLEENPAMASSYVILAYLRMHSFEIHEETNPIQIKTF